MKLKDLMQELRRFSVDMETNVKSVAKNGNTLIMATDTITMPKENKKESFNKVLKNLD